jgi:hypothetical protein
MRKPGFTPAEHAEIGRVLAAIHDELTTRSAQVANAYPKNVGQVKHLRDAAKALLSARVALDSALYREDREAFSTYAYFPHPEDRKAARAELLGDGQ